MESKFAPPKNHTLREFPETPTPNLVLPERPLEFGRSQPTYNQSVESLIPEQSTHLFRLRAIQSPASLNKVREIFEEIARFVPARLVHQEIIRNLEKYAQLRDERAGNGEILPKLEIRLGGLGRNSGNDQGNYAHSKISSTGEGLPSHTVTIDHWFNLEKIKSDNVPLGSVVINELANVNMLLDVLNSGIEKGLSFDLAWAAALNTTSNPSFEIFTYSTDIGFARLRDEQDSTFRTPWNSLENIPAETLVETFNKAAEESALRYFRTYQPYLLSSKEGELERKPPTSSRNTASYASFDRGEPQSNPALIRNSQGVLFLDDSQQLMRQHQERQLRLYTNNPDIEATTRKITVPLLGEITIPALRIKESKE